MVNIVETGTTKEFEYEGARFVLADGKRTKGAADAAMTMQNPNGHNVIVQTDWDKLSISSTNPKDGSTVTSVIEDSETARLVHNAIINVNVREITPERQADVAAAMNQVLAATGSTLNLDAAVAALIALDKGDPLGEVDLIKGRKGEYGDYLTATQKVGDMIVEISSESRGNGRTDNTMLLHKPGAEFGDGVYSSTSNIVFDDGAQGHVKVDGEIAGILSPKTSQPLYAKITAALEDGIFTETEARGIAGDNIAVAKRALNVNRDWVDQGAEFHNRSGEPLKETGSVAMDRALKQAEAALGEPQSDKPKLANDMPPQKTAGLER